MIKVEDLKCGDTFVFRDKQYIALMNFTDMRHTQTIITAIPVQKIGSPITEVVVLRLFRTFRVQRVTKRDIKLTILENTEQEITKEIIQDLKVQKS